MVALVALAALFAPWPAPYDPNEVDLGDALAGTGADHLLGADTAGRDTLSRPLLGARASLLGPLGVVVFSTVLGVAVGMAAAWRGGWLDSVLSRSTEVVFAFPGLLLAILIISVYGEGLLAPVIALAVAHLPYVSRLARSLVLAERERPYVAYRVQGHAPLSICVRHTGTPVRRPAVRPDRADRRRVQRGRRAPGRPCRQENPMTTTYALGIQGLRITLPGTARPVLDGVDLTVAAGETVALVGESGSGKTLTSRSALRLLPPGALVQGTVAVAGDDVLAMSAERATALRTGEGVMIFQDPRAAINPLRRIGDFLTEGVVLPKVMSRADATARATELLRAVGVDNAILDKYPGQVSGGVLQRVMIAGALMGDPSLLLADEPTTALDVTTQAEVVAPPRPAPAAIRDGAAVRRPPARSADDPDRLSLRPALPAGHRSLRPGGAGSPVGPGPARTPGRLPPQRPLRRESRRCLSPRSRR